MEDYVYTDLIKSGLTPSLIEQFFDPPDRIEKNPKNPRWAPMKLYDRQRVERIIRSDEFLEEFVKLDDKRIIRQNAAARQFYYRII